MVDSGMLLARDACPTLRKKGNPFASTLTQGPFEGSAAFVWKSSFSFSKARSLLRHPA